MIGACDKQFFGTDSIEDLQYIEEFLGEYEHIIVEGKKSEPRTQREINKLLTTSAIGGVIEKSEAGEGYQIVKPTNGLPVILNLMPCYWVVDKYRYGWFIEAQVPPYEQQDFEEDSNENIDTEALTTEDIIDIFTENHFKRKKASTEKSSFKAGEKGPLRRDVDKLRAELDELKEKMKNR